jgi:hypothetical protein
MELWMTKELRIGRDLDIRIHRFWGGYEIRLKDVINVRLYL